METELFNHLVDDAESRLRASQALTNKNKTDVDKKLPPEHQVTYVTSMGRAVDMLLDLRLAAPSKAHQHIIDAALVKLRPEVNASVEDEILFSCLTELREVDMVLA